MAIIETTRAGISKAGSAATRADLTAKSAIGSKLDVDAIKVGIAEKPSFVLEQFPAAGQEVPAGTTINLVMLPKDNVRVDDVVVDPRVKGAFAEQDITKVREEIEMDPRLKTVFDRGTDFDALTDDDKRVFTEYVREKGIVGADTTSADLKSLHGDLEILYRF